MIPLDSSPGAPMRTVDDPPAQVIEESRRAVAREAGVKLGSVRVVRSPYRVCPLGAHVDHQGGAVTAMALDRGLILAYAPSSSREVSVSSLDFPGRVRFSLDAVPGPTPDDWGNYVRGAAAALQSGRRLDRGMVGVTSGRLHGGGVSSSAAVGIAYLLALEDVNGFDVEPRENIELDRKIENDYLGLQNGILDQAAVLLSRHGCLTRIDCRTGRHEVIPAPAGARPFRILLAFSGVSRGLVGTDYNRRVDECIAAARDLLKAAGRPEAPSLLGEVRPEEYQEHSGRLTGPPARRAAHFFGEADRVREGVEAWARGDLSRFGELMTASGESSIAYYECGSPPLIDLFRALVDCDGVLGARFSGAGFRGCCAALVDPVAVGEVTRRVAAEYAGRHPDLARHGGFVVCGTGDGATIVDADRVALKPGRRDPMPRAS